MRKEVLYFYSSIRNKKFFITEPQPVFVENMNISMPIVKTDETTRYVPMGRHIILNCVSWNSAGYNYDNQNKPMKWIFRDIQDYRSIPIDIKNR